jgi:hypothetical protein
MYQAARDVHAESQEPQHQQNYKSCPKHNFSSTIRSLRRSEFGCYKVVSVSGSKIAGYVGPDRCTANKNAQNQSGRFTQLKGVENLADVLI